MGKVIAAGAGVGIVALSIRRAREGGFGTRRDRALRRMARLIRDWSRRPHGDAGPQLAELAVVLTRFRADEPADPPADGRTSDPLFRRDIERLAELLAVPAAERTRDWTFRLIELAQWIEQDHMAHTPAWHRECLRETFGRG